MDGTTAMEQVLAGPLAEKSVTIVNPGLATTNVQGEMAQLAPLNDWNVLPGLAVAVSLTLVPIG